jgi:hypothetical protein
MTNRAPVYGPAGYQPPAPLQPQPPLPAEPNPSESTKEEDDELAMLGIDPNDLAGFGK